MMNKFSKFIFVLVLLGCGFLFAKSASAATYYVSKTATNGYQIGNDTNNGTSKSTPFLSIYKAYFVTITNQDTIYVNDGTYNALEGSNPDAFFRFEKGTTILPENAGQVTLTASTGGGLVVYAKLFASASTTIGAINIDAGGVSYGTGSLYVSPQGAGTSLTLLGTILINQKSYGIYNGYSTNGYNFTARNISISGTSVTQHAIYLSGIIGGVIDIDGVALNWVGAGADNQGVYINAGVTYPTVSIKNVTGTVTSTGTANGVWVKNVPNTLIENSTLTITSTSVVGGGGGLRISADTGKSADGGIIRYNNITMADKAPQTIIIGSSVSTGNGHANNGQIYNNTVTGINNWDQTITPHGIMMGQGNFTTSGFLTSGGSVYNNIVTGFAPNYLCAECDSTVVFHNNIGVNSYSTSAGNMLSKGSNGVKFYNNTLINNVGYNGVLFGMYAHGDGTNNTNVDFENNIGINLNTTNPIFTYGASNQTAVMDHNVWWSPASSLASNAFRYTTNNYGTFSAWQAAGHDTNSIFIDPKINTDGTLELGSPAIDAGTNLGSDYDDALLPTSSWPLSVTTADQDLRGSGWEIGAYINPVPFAPTIGTPAVQSTSSIRWNFTDNASDETGFKLYDNTNTLATSSATADLTYLDETGLSPNIQYTGRYVTAYNSYGNSASSSVASSVYTLANPPSTPTLTAPSSSSLNTVLDVNGNPADTNFAIYNSTSGKYLQADGTLGNSAVWQTYSLWGSASGTTTTGLLENTQYTYQTIAKNGDNIETASSTDVSKYTLDDTPTNLSASLNSNNITLTVDSLPNATSGSSGYYFSRSGANSGWIQTNSWTDTGLSCGHSYDYSVIYRNGDGTETSSISTSKSTSGCGGGGGSPAMWTLPTMPAGGFKININNGALTTSNRNVFLSFNAGADIKKVAVSMTGDFTDASQEDYIASRQWDLCSKLGGAIKNPTCPDGTYKVYAQFYTAYGRTTGNAFASSTIVLKSSTIPTENLQQTNNLPFTNLFTKYLQYRQTNADIKRLQIFLNSDPDTKIAVSGAGSPGKETNYFGILTYKAVIKFQEKYAKDVLVPWGFVKGTGYVGKTTLAKINELMKNK